MSDNISLAGKVAIITGAGSGIGKASAKLFLERGAKVVAADLKKDTVDVLASEWPEYADSLRAFEVNVSNKEQVEAMIDFAVAEFGQLDVLFNNAGIMDGMVPLGSVTDDGWNLAFDVNVNGVMYAMRKAINYFLERGQGGVIVNTASVGGLNGGRAGAAYTASKHAVIGMTKAAAFEYAPQGIRCVALAPGGVITNIGMGANADMAMYEQMKPGLALMRGGAAQPEQLAEAAAFLASDAASFVNGSTLIADGGWTAY